MRYDNIRCFKPFGEEGEDKILAVSSAWDELPEFQQNGEQSNQGDQVRKHGSPVPDFGLYAERFV